MRTWRVGTLSMGLSLIFLGVTLFLSQLQGLNAFDTFFAWWPILFVLLGLEILVYLIWMRKENSMVRYDLMSVFFVGLLFISSFGLTFLTSIGVLGEVRRMVGTVERTVDLPEMREAVDERVKRIIVQTNGPQVKVDQTAERAVHLFGSYRERTQEDQFPEVSEKNVYTVRTIGDTMYVQVKQPPIRQGFDSYYPYMNVTVVLPQDIPAELREQG
ncbi:MULTISPECIES: LiaF transmembrane domain-containing protein [Paenibacillus]|uniref:Lipoprotein n=1 Tax=Paenibacillus naphthalenovorans TaxID=162209 RepID=A0A0U2VV19_9BACL|nr:MULTISPECIES: hypothetical protein [Paenibacillus]ALS24550.1 lipoprotein [Paenibacillus naphthalenovorans]NTZ20823.1 hypothetical protein [Paenibacillus sp. JMULE4]